MSSYHSLLRTSRVGSESVPGPKRFRAARVTTTALQGPFRLSFKPIVTRQLFGRPAPFEWQSKKTRVAAAQLSRCAFQEVRQALAHHIVVQILMPRVTAKELLARLVWPGLR